MARQKTGSRSKKQTTQTGRPPWTRYALALTLVPFVAGVFFIALWAMDFLIWEGDFTQAYIGILLILLGFTASNAVQKNWSLALGWGLLMAADLVLLVVVNFYFQILALLLGGLGLILILFEFYKRFRAQNAAG